MEITHLTESSTRKEGFRIKTEVSGDIHIYRVERRSDGVVVPAARYFIDGRTGRKEERAAELTDAVAAALEERGFTVEQ